MQKEYMGMGIWDLPMREWDAGVEKWGVERWKWGHVDLQTGAWEFEKKKKKKKED